MPNLSKLLDEKVLKILTVLYANKGKFFHLTQLAQASSVPAATTLRMLKPLVDSGIIEVSSVGKIKIYRYYDNFENNTFMKVLEQ
jgi:DNA-binding IclR family transcriptional regulator